MSWLTYGWPLNGTSRRWDAGICWRSRLVTSPVDEPVGVDYVRDKVLRVVNGTEDDEYIRNQIAAARQVCEEESFQAVMPQTWQLLLSGFPGAWIELPRPPLLSITSFEYLDAAGDSQTLAGSPAEYRVLPSGQYTPARIGPLSGATWPSTYDCEDAVTITYEAGYATAEDVPERIKAGIGLLVEEMYKNRGLSMSAGRVKSMVETSRFWRRRF